MTRRTQASAPSQERSDTRERILEVAIDLFARHGFEACTVRDLATAVGIKAPGIYSHFASKEAILSEAMVRALNDFLAYMAAPSSATTPRDELRETVHRHVLYQLEHLQVTRANDLLLNSETIGQFLPERDHKLLLDVQRSYVQLVRDRVRAAIPDNPTLDLTTTSFAIITMCDRVTTWYNPGGRLTPRDVADQYWTLVRGMLHLS
jgi:TetR/AcrR family transcriptional regulator, cholesterol catabolism regulator